jgi:hypothetical protein
MKDDKKKLIVVLALALVIVAVGVFQFTSGGSSTPPAATAKKEEKKVIPEEPIEPPKNPMFATNLPARDPFREPASLSTSAPNVPPQGAPIKGEIQQPAPEYSAPRMPPLSGQLEPNFNGNPNAPLTVQVTEKQFSYRLSGVMLGAKPMAVFTDLQGNQRLILLGGSLEPDCNVLSITKEAVTVRFHGKTLRLTVEGNPHDK